VNTAPPDSGTDPGTDPGTRTVVLPTPAGPFELRPVALPEDLALLHRWMNDPEVDRFWDLAGPVERTERHLSGQLRSGHSRPLLGLLDGTPMSYWEVYRADLDPLAEHYPARAHDLGVHLLLGPAASRGRGLGAILLDALATHLLDTRPDCGRVLAEPDLHNTRSLAAFGRAGFQQAVQLRLPEKTAALMVRRRRPGTTPHPPESL
jgi:RimJ/RimL family protein N-acetyltransferase